MSEKLATERVLELGSQSSSKELPLDSEHNALADVALPSNATSVEKTAFLASFTAAEERRIMRKVDFRLLVLMPLMLMIKNVELVPQIQVFSKLRRTDRHRQCGSSKSPAGKTEPEYSRRATDDCR